MVIKRRPKKGGIVMDNMFLDSHVNLEGNKMNLNNVVKRGRCQKNLMHYPQNV